MPVNTLKSSELARWPLLIQPLNNISISAKSVINLISNQILRKDNNFILEISIMCNEWYITTFYLYSLGLRLLNCQVRSRLNV